MITPYNHKGLTAEEQAIFTVLHNKLATVQGHNLQRKLFYDAEQTIRHIGIALPRQYQQVASNLGWIKTACNAITNRINFEGIVSAGDSNPYGLQDIFTDNDMDLEANLAIASAAKYGMSFLTVTQGDTLAGEPSVLINNRSALNTTVLWNRRLRRPDAGLTVLKSERGEVIEFILYLPSEVISVTEAGVQRIPNPTGRAPITVLRYQPDADEDRLGRSHITKPMMGLVSHATRITGRVEMNAELYSFPARYALNVGDDSLLDENDEPIDALRMAMTSFLTFPAPEYDPLTGQRDPETKVGQFSTGSMTPHVDEMEMIAAQFAAEAHMPISSLGVKQSQPESSEAQETANGMLIQDAENAFVSLGSGLRDAAKLAYLVENRTTELPPELRSLSARFRNASTPTQAASADATVKLVGAGIIPADSDVALERSGLSQTDIERVKEDRRKAQAAERINNVLTAAQNRTSQIFPTTEESPEQIEQPVIEA